MHACMPSFFVPASTSYRDDDLHKMLDVLFVAFLHACMPSFFIPTSTSYRHDDLHKLFWNLAYFCSAPSSRTMLIVHSNLFVPDIMVWGRKIPPSYQCARKSNHDCNVPAVGTYTYLNQWHSLLLGGKDDCTIQKWIDRSPYTPKPCRSMGTKTVCLCIISMALKLLIPDLDTLYICVLREMDPFDASC